MQRVDIALFRAFGAAIAIGLMEVLAGLAGEPMFRVPFVTSIVLAMSAPDSAPAQPRSIVGGHMLSCLAGYLTVAVLGIGDLASAAAGLLHPPAGICAFQIGAYGLPLQWAVSPVLIGAVLLSTFAALWRAGERYTQL